MKVSSLIYNDTMTGEGKTLKRANEYLMFFVNDLCEYDFARRSHESDSEWAKRMYIKLNSLKVLAEDCRTKVMMLACCDKSLQGDPIDDDDSL